MAKDSSLVVFDLDDTLIDTRGVLLPAALRRVSDATGIPVERLNPRGKKIEEVLEGFEGLAPERREAAARVWYAPDVPPLEPLPGAKRTLDTLRDRVRLVLVTRGDPARQRAKIERSGLGPSFDEVRIRAIEEPGSKRDDFRELMTRHGCPPERCAVVGDDERDELAHGAALGWLVLKVPDTPLRDVPRRLAAAGLVRM